MRTRRGLSPLGTLVGLTLALSAQAGAKGWATVEGDRGISMEPVLVCRTLGDLRGVAGAAEANRAVFAQAAALRGRCTRLPAYSLFTVVSHEKGAMQIRTAKHGRLWVAPANRVPNLSELPLRGRLVAEPRTQPTPRYTEEESREIEEQLSAKETVPGVAGQVRIGGPSQVPGVAESNSWWSSPRVGGRVKVRGYTRKDGTYVRPHPRRRPSR